MLTFAIGVLTRQWHIAVMGIVYSYLTAAAMWQNFRARLPYLYDPWSEKLPPPPTLMHAMIAISVLVEGGAVVTGMVIAFAGARKYCGGPSYRLRILRFGRFHRHLELSGPARSFVRRRVSLAGERDFRTCAGCLVGRSRRSAAFSPRFPLARLAECCWVYSRTGT